MTLQFTEGLVMPEQSFGFDYLMTMSARDGHQAVEFDIKNRTLAAVEKWRLQHQQGPITLAVIRLACKQAYKDDKRAGNPARYRVELEHFGIHHPVFENAERSESEH
jgi:hypothetical protein